MPTFTLGRVVKSAYGKLRDIFVDGKGIYVLSDQLVVTGGNFLVVVLASRMLSSDVFGVFGYVLTLYVLSVIVNMAMIFQPSTVVYGQLNSKEKFVGAIIPYQISIALLTSLLYSVIVYTQIGEGYQSITNYMLLLIYFFLQQLSDFGRRISYIVNNEKNAFFYSFFVYSIRLVLIVLMAESVAGMLLALILSVLITSGIQLSIAFKALKYADTDHSLIKKSLFKNSKWLIVSVPFVWYWCNAPVFVLGWIGGLELVGVFVALRSMTNIGNVLLEIVETKGAVLYAKFHFSQSLSMDYIHSVIVCMALIVWSVVMITFVFFGDYLLVRIFGEEYGRYSHLLIILWLMQGFVFLFKTGNVFYRTRKETLRVLVGYVSGSILVSLVAFPLMNYEPLIGASTTLLIGSFSIFLSQKLFSLGNK